MNKKDKETIGQGKVFLRYVNGPTGSYQFEIKFTRGLAGLVSQEAARELLQMRHEGQPMFSLVPGL